MKATKTLTILVLALGSMAHGSIYLTVNDQPLDSIVLEAGESCTVEIVSDSSFSYEGYIGFYDGLSLGSFTHLQTGPAAGNRAMVTQYDDGSFSGYKATPDGFLQRPGVHFVFEFEAEQAGETDVILAEMFKNELTSIDSVHITVTRGPMGTAFTYQGSLNDAGSPADGSYDFEFKLYNSPADGNQVGTTLDVKELDVISGQFAVKLDFGSDVFDGDARWLEIGVRPGELEDPNEYTILLPRIELTPTPYAIYAETAGGGIGGGGTTNHIPKFTAPNTIGDSVIYESAGGNVGIGTTSPLSWAKLDVDGAVRATSLDVQGTDQYTVRVINNGSGVAGSYWGGLFASNAGGSAMSNYGISGQARGVSAQNIGGLFQATDGSENFAIYSARGKNYFADPVGIGTKTPLPGYKLTVDGEGTRQGIYVNNVGGIGIESIGTIYGLIASGSLKAVYGTGGARGGDFRADAEGGVGVYGVATDEGDMKNYGGRFGAQGKYGVGIYAHGGSNGSAAEFNGNVIIQFGRTITPVLEITGGSDLSEQFEIRGISADMQPSAGMVVSIDAESPGDLVVSNKGYDRRVAGIISGAGGLMPGMLMGQKGSKADGKNPVALTGRVYCWADASNAAIQPGDLLTTSDTPGHAMKVKDYKRAQGAILGKAMSSLESGRGLVLVLVTLQ